MAAEEEKKSYTVLKNNYYFKHKICRATACTFLGQINSLVVLKEGALKCFWHSSQCLFLWKGNSNRSMLKPGSCAMSLVFKLL